MNTAQESSHEGRLRRRRERYRQQRDDKKWYLTAYNEQLEAMQGEQGSCLEEKILMCTNEMRLHYHQSTNVVKQISVKVKDKIGMTLDMETGKLDFDINGKYVDVGFTDLPRDKPLYPSISAVYGNSEITMIYYGRPVVG